ncbi:Protein transport protein Sec61 subunit beta [Glycine soja]|uniref:Protein transport protein Sec61 subunit beta n=1 Tax=Glycine soja TaxID=3848 RepID=A0A0B2QZQ1_GLYSO|nr:Protein transport protein Sec61 subunit beta [Glycine soja]
MTSAMSQRFSILHFNSHATKTSRHGSPRVHRRHRGFAVATTSMHRRRLNNRNSSTSTVIGGGNNNILRFYTDDAPGLKISPTMVLVMSFCFIGFTALHVFGKLYRSKSGGAV